MDKIFSMKKAADFYNEYVRLLFDKGFLVFPMDFIDELSVVAHAFGYPCGMKPIDI